MWPIDWMEILSEATAKEENKQTFTWPFQKLLKQPLKILVLIK